MEQVYPRRSRANLNHLLQSGMSAPFIRLTQKGLLDGVRTRPDSVTVSNARPLHHEQHLKYRDDRI
jgi:hypothetical protein